MIGDNSNRFPSNKSPNTFAVINLKLFNMMTVNFDSLPQVVQELNAKIDNITLLLQSAKPDAKQSELLSIQEAATFLNLSKSTLYNKVNRNELPYMKKGKRLYFSRIELVDYIKSGKIPSIQEIQEQTDTFLSKKSRI